MTISIPRTLFAVATLGLAALNPLQSQPPGTPSRAPQLPPELGPPPPPVIRVGTRLVEVEVVVRDKDGSIWG